MISPADARAAAHLFVDALDDECEITGKDGHHFQRVRRLRVGEHVTAADGSGAWRTYEIVATGPARLRLAARTETVIEPAPALRVGVAPALGPGVALDFVAALTEVGVSHIVPVRTARSVKRWDDERGARHVETLRTTTREAAMQCRRARLPEIEPVTDLAQLATRAGLVVADRAGVRAHELDAPPGDEWTVLVGPEGGLTDEELTVTAAAPRLALGRYVLRAAVAPVVAAALLAERATLLWSE